MGGFIHVVLVDCVLWVGGVDGGPPVFEHGEVVVPSVEKAGETDEGETGNEGGGGGCPVFSVDEIGDEHNGHDFDADYG